MAPSACSRQKRSDRGPLWTSGHWTLIQRHRWVCRTSDGVSPCGVSVGNLLARGHTAAPDVQTNAKGRCWQASRGHCTSRGWAAGSGSTVCALRRHLYGEDPPREYFHSCRKTFPRESLKTGCRLPRRGGSPSNVHTLFQPEAHRHLPLVGVSSPTRVS